MQPAEAPSGSRRSGPSSGASPYSEEEDDDSPPQIMTAIAPSFKVPTPEEISKEWRLLDSMVTKEPHDDAFRMLRYPTAMQPNNVGKNRWKDVLPDEVTRVKLECTADEDWCSTDYINANHIRPAESSPGLPLPGVPSYIACQAPTLDTLADFWRMIWQQRVPVIVMLTRLTEGSKPKATQYWPQWLNTPTSYGKLIVTLLNEEFLSGNCSAIIRSLRIEPSANSGAANEPPRVLFHLHYEEWPDFGVPESTRLLRDVLAYIDTLQQHWSQAQSTVLSGVSLKDALASSSSPSPANNHPSPHNASSTSSSSSPHPRSLSGSTASLSASMSLPGLSSSSHSALTLSSSGASSSSVAPRGHSTSAALPVPRKTSTSAIQRKPSSSPVPAPRKPSNVRTADAIVSPRGGSTRAGSAISVTNPSSSGTVNNNHHHKRHSMHGALMSSSSSSCTATLARPPPDPSMFVNPHPRPALSRSIPASAAQHTTSSPSLANYSKRMSLAQSDPEERRSLGLSGVIASPPSSASNSPRTRSRSASDVTQSQSCFGPLVFHCSAGIGRAGTLLAIHISLERMRHGLEVTVAETVHLLRQQRRGMVQNEEQYAFIYRVLGDIVHEKQREDRLRRRGGDDLRSAGVHNSPPGGFL